MSSTNTKRKLLSKQLRRECFITIGATAAFLPLLEASIQPDFLDKLNALAYTHLTMQCGPEHSHIQALITGNTKLSDSSIEIRTFAFNASGLGKEMLGCKSQLDIAREGVVICHAGAGTVLDAMRIDVPIIVVPNPALLDNHQEELAKELEKQGYATYGNLRNLTDALSRSEDKSTQRTGWPPADSKEGGVMQLVDEELGYEARMREILD